MSGAEIGFIRGGWRKGIDSIPTEVTLERRTLREALAAGVVICNGSGVGAFQHDEAWRGGATSVNRRAHILVERAHLIDETERYRDG
jgi:hypothetical protein